MAHLDQNHKDTFCKDTLMEILKAIMRLCHLETGVMPNSKRIIQDCKRIIKSAETIVNAGGKVVLGLVDRNGHKNRRNVGRIYYSRMKDMQLKPWMIWEFSNMSKQLR